MKYKSSSELNLSARIDRLAGYVFALIFAWIVLILVLEILTP